MHALVLQCGGPTAVVNATLAALIRRWQELQVRGMLLAGRYGVSALRGGDWQPISDAPDEWVAHLETTPGMALGGGRERLRQDELAGTVRLLHARSVDTLFLIGGNGTMAAGRELAAHAAHSSVRLQIVGVPKTIDNDVPLTDICPGFPSAARFLIDAVRDVWADVSSMRGYEDVVLIEAMGRHTGWLAAATLLARSRSGDAPHVVLVPEQHVIEDAFLAAIRAAHAREGVCLATVAEGVRAPSGTFITAHGAGREIEHDPSGQVILGRSGGPLPHLATLVRERLGLRCRLIRPDVLQRCSRAHVPALDRLLAATVGRAAVDAALTSGGASTCMIALRRTSAGWRTEPVPLDQIRGERTLPAAMLADPAALAALLT